MTDIFIVLSLILVSVFGTTVSSFDFGLVPIAIMAGRRDKTRALLLAFFGGLLADLILGRTLGAGAVLYLIIVMLVQFYRQRFSGHPLVILLVIIVGELVYGLVRRFLF